MQRQFSIHLVAAMLLSASVLACVRSDQVLAQERSAETYSVRKDFINVDGAGFEARLANAVKLARSRSAQTPFFVAYRFNVRPGIRVDLEVMSNGRQINVEGISISPHSANPSRNVGVFLRYAPDGVEIAEVRVHDLDRRREFPSPVYWLGQIPAEESIEFLTRLAESEESSEVAERAALAIAIHDDPKAETRLIKLVRSARTEKAKAASALWLGQFTNRRDALAELVRDERSSREVCGAAALGLGMSGDREGLSFLQALYRAVTERGVREHILVAIVSHKQEGAAIDFLVKLAEDRADTEARRQALFWLGQKAGERSLKTFRETVDGADEETEVQTHAVFAVSQRPADESIPLLIRIARTHPKAAVRKQAMFWLGQTGDERALSFFREVLGK